jgi:DNA polymerase
MQGHCRRVPDVTWTAEPFVPASKSLPVLREAVQACKGCPLYEDTTQAVFGEQEDKKGHVFVGPAGRVLWSCVEDAGIDRDLVYATNAVKHFKHEMRGKRRIHKKPNTDEIEACHPWIDAELKSVNAAVIVVLGATAARSLFGRTVPIAASRQQTLTVANTPAIVTYHPSAVLRADEAAAEIRAALVEDLRRARQLARVDA